MLVWYGYIFYQTGSFCSFGQYTGHLALNVTAADCRKQYK